MHFHERAKNHLVQSYCGIENLFELKNIVFILQKVHFLNNSNQVNE